MESYVYNIETCKILHCNKCDISVIRKHIVNGVGKLDSSLMIIGEAPGYKEDKLGIPFVGDSGKLLDAMLEGIGLTRDSVYITNVTKCRPNDNNITSIQISNCYINLDKELMVIKPKIVLLLGSVAINRYFNKSDITVKDIRGRTIVHNGTVIIGTYHPSYILRNIESERLLNSYVADFIRLAEVYKKLINPYITIKFEL